MVNVLGVEHLVSNLVDVLFTLTINVGGTAVELEVRNGDVPQDVAVAFATEHKLDIAARDKIIKAIIDKATQIRSGEAQPQATADGGAPAAAAPPSDATAAAPSGGKKVLFSLDVNLGKEGGNVPLPVHAGAVPSELAQQFAARASPPSRPSSLRDSMPANCAAFGA